MPPPAVVRNDHGQQRRQSTNSLVRPADDEAQAQRPAPSPKISVALPTHEMGVQALLDEFIARHLVVDPRPNPLDVAPHCVRRDEPSATGAGVHDPTQHSIWRSARLCQYGGWRTRASTLALL